MAKSHRSFTINLIQTIGMLLIPTILVCFSPIMSYVKYGYIIIILGLFLIYGSFVLKRTIGLLQEVFKPKNTINASLLFIMFAYISFILIFGTLYFNLTVLTNNFTQTRAIERYVTEAIPLEGVDEDNGSIIKGLKHQVWDIDYDKVEVIKETHKNFRKALSFNFTKALSLFNETFYFSAITMVTIGYGDMVPVSALSRILSIIQGLLGQIILVYGVGMAFYTKEVEAD